MAGRISELPAGSALDGTELVEASQTVSGVLTSVRTTVSAFFALLRTLGGTWTKAQTVAPVSLTSGSTVAIDASLSNNFSLTMTGACKLGNPTNLVAGMVLNFTVDQDATGGRALTFDTLYKWPAGVAPTWSTAANAKSMISVYYDGTVLRCSGATGYA